MTPSPLLVYCSFPNAEVARSIGAMLLDRRLAACVSFQEGTQSLYRWQGKIESADEVIAAIKTSDRHFAELDETIRRHHPYEVPEIIGLPIVEISPAYREWLFSELGDS